MGKHTLQELQQKQALPLNVKIRMTEQRIEEWVDEYGEDGVYVSFSGGKDSTVLLDIARKLYPGIKAVFVDTGLEYPEIRQFVRTFDNVDIIRPKMSFKEVIEKYGYPFISKEVSPKVAEAKSKPNGYASKSFNGERKPPYDYSKYAFLLNSPFKIDGKCCNAIKKNPCKDYERTTSRKGMTAQMASESFARTKEWIVNGCNSFDKKRPISNPMSFWTEQDVLLYIYEKQLPIASVYGEVVVDYYAMGQVDGQMSFSDFGEFEKERPLLKTTGSERTGCMFCGYGCHLERGTGRFERMKETHPKQYDYIMRSKDDGGLGYREVIDWINKNGNMKIRY